MSNCGHLGHRDEKWFNPVFSIRLNFANLVGLKFLRQLLSL